MQSKLLKAILHVQLYLYHRSISGHCFRISVPNCQWPWSFTFVGTHVYLCRLVSELKTDVLNEENMPTSPTVSRLDREGNGKDW